MAGPARARYLPPWERAGPRFPVGSPVRFMGPPARIARPPVEEEKLPVVPVEVDRAILNMLSPVEMAEYIQLVQRANMLIERARQRHAVREAVRLIERGPPAPRPRSRSRSPPRTRARARQAEEERMERRMEAAAAAAAEPDISFDAPGGPNVVLRAPGGPLYFDR
jgi:hypothetical protein